MSLLSEEETREGGQYLWSHVSQGARSPRMPTPVIHCRAVQISSPNLVNIVYEETYGELVGAAVFAQLPRLQAPSLPEVLRPPRLLR